MPKQLSRSERDQIARWHAQQRSQAEIAAALRRAPSTISRELARNGTPQGYFAAGAQERAVRRRRERPLVRKLDRPDVNEDVRDGLARCWSPDQIAGRMQIEFPNQPRRRVAAETIYRWIRSRPREERSHWRQFLRRRGRRPARRPGNPADSARHARIADRPAIVARRGRLGDFEGDTVLGPPGTGGLITLVDRRSRYTILAKTKNKQALRVRRRIQQRLAALEPAQRRSLTFDCGSEFARCKLLEQRLGVQVYSAQPGCPYQRGTNENTNGLVRQFFPKGTDFRTVSPVAVQRVQDLLNHRPRRCLGYRTPHEVFHGVSLPRRCD
jgi:IS30 family transposase